MDFESLTGPIIIAGVAIGAGALASAIASAIEWFGRRHGSSSVVTEVQLCRKPWTVLAVALAAEIAAHNFPEVGIGWRRGGGVVVIGAACWLLVRSLRVGELMIFNLLRMDVKDNRRIRRARTQVMLLRRVLGVVVVVLGLAAALMTFPQLRAIGASVLASAGLVGIVAGLAAQTTLANMVAGLQLAFTDAIRIDDVVVVQGEWGWVEELTLTYVVVHVWDERRLVLPTSYFTTTPFENWTRSHTRVLGSVLFHLDYATPLTALRECARQVIESSEFWDGEDWILQVIDTTDTTMIVRVVASACDGPTAWDLRCAVREALLGFLQQNYPQALPVRRLITTQSGPPIDPVVRSAPAGPLDSGRENARRLEVDLLELDRPALDRVKMGYRSPRRADLRRAERRNRAPRTPIPSPRNGHV